MAQKIVCDVCDTEAPLPAQGWSSVRVQPSDTNFSLDVCPDCTTMLKGGVKALLLTAFADQIQARKAAS
jgi:hypothetical protein